jgi:hypothetical protein
LGTCGAFRASARDALNNRGAARTLTLEELLHAISALQVEEGGVGISKFKRGREVGGGGWVDNLKM